MLFTNLLLYREPSFDQKAVFSAIAPIVERNFPKASAWTSSCDTEVTFNCGYTEEPPLCNITCYLPEEDKLYKLVDYLNELSFSQHSKIKFRVFRVWDEDFGALIPMGIKATWN